VARAGHLSLALTLGLGGKTNRRSNSREYYMADEVVCQGAGILHFQGRLLPALAFGFGGVFEGFVRGGDGAAHILTDVSAAMQAARSRARTMQYKHSVCLVFLRKDIVVRRCQIQKG